MNVQLNPPQVRECETCGRRERWDNDAGGWRIEEIDGEKVVGNPHCIHEWDINGTHRPLDSP